MDIIHKSITNLRQLVQVEVQSSWQSCPEDLPIEQGMDPTLWPSALTPTLNDRGHIAWPAGQQVLWLGQRFGVPQDLQGYPLEGLGLRLVLTWWADQAQIFVNGHWVQAGDLFDCSPRILLSEAVTPNTEMVVALRLISPGHDDGALVRSHLIFEPSDRSCLDPGFVADELAVLQGYLEKFQPQSLEDLAAATRLIDWSTLGQPALFHKSLQSLRQSLQPMGNWLQQRQISYVGHAHLDLAWLWPVSETWEVAQNTFESVLALQQEFPDWVFCHSTPALYAWIEAQRPDLFKLIQAQVAAGRWEVTAGLWVEPEFNLVSGEALVRQIFYGQHYTLEKFGAVSPIAWLPDSFGFCWQLPQMLKQGGVEYFVTQKLRWNDSTEFPWEVFWWRSPDGTQIFSAMLPPIGEGIDPVKMATFAQTWETATGVPETLWLPGVGDHGGGPTQDMLATAQRWQQSSLFPRLKPTSAQEFLQTLEAKITDPPVWEDELYLEYHRGCYTTHAGQKRANRRSEILLYRAELFAAFATLSAGAIYPKASLEAAWKQILFNQFHDILPGSSIPEVFADANRNWQAVVDSGTQILNESLQAIAAQIALPPPPDPAWQPMVVFNSLNWQRSEVIHLQVPQPAPGETWQAYDFNQQPVPSQLHDSPAGTELLFLASEVPGVGYRVFWLVPQPVPDSQPCPGKFILENEFLKVVVNPQTGELASVFDQQSDREVLRGAGNQLRFFQDSGQYWDAWNIDPNYAQHSLGGAELQKIEWRAWGPVQQRLRVVQQFNQSQFCQDYVLEAGSRSLKIETTVDWQERQVLVKAAFPLTVQADTATYEIPCGAIQRPTLPNSEPLEAHQAAKWEVPALQWADLSNLAGDYGVSLLNDCKYGYDAQPDQLRLTLLRSPNWPDPNADRGSHQFTYALYPHPGSWQVAQTPRRGFELNQPLQAIELNPTPASTSQMPPVGQLLHLSADNLILMAFKQAESNPQGWILRCYEGYGEPASLELQSDLNLVVAQPVDLLEQSVSMPKMNPNKIDPWKIVSFQVEAS